MKMNEKTTILDIYHLLNKTENNFWDEYISTFSLPQNIDDKTFYELHETGRLEVLPVFGGNEGIYCHISIGRYQNNKWTPVHLFTLKTLNASRTRLLECWESAGRIYNYLTGGEL